MPDFDLNSAYSPTADQPKAIAGLAEGVEAGERFMTLLGATGTGKTFTMAATIERARRPALVIAHNKTLAAQLCNEFREFFPEASVEYFVSYYDYYQPEAYVPAQDLYIEKDATVNDEIDRLRHAATAALFARRDVIIVASVSCIYGIGSPELYREQMVLFKVGEEIERETLFRQLIAMQYQRNDTILTRGTFRVKGEVLEVFPAYAESAYRIQLFGDEVESITHFDPLTGEVLDEVDHVSVWPATHYVTKEETIERAVDQIRFELEEQIAVVRGAGQGARGAPAAAADPVRPRDAEGARLLQRDRELLADPRRPRPPAPPPHTLIDYFPSDFVVFIDESHQTMPQIGGMYEGDRSRKLTLVDHGFRLPSAIDNRPLKFDEFLERVGQVVMVSATPGEFERTKASGSSSRSSARPGSSIPRSRSARRKNQIDDLMNEVRVTAERKRAGAGHDADEEDVRGPDRVPARARLPRPLPALRGRHDRADPDHPRPAAGRVRRARRRQPAARGARHPRGRRSSRSSTPTRRASCAARPA